jgi:hypothetical protein
VPATPGISVSGTLAAGEWGWGDADGLGFDTLYVRLNDGTDPDTKAVSYVIAHYTTQSILENWIADEYTATGGTIRIGDECMTYTAAVEDSPAVGFCAFAVLAFSFTELATLPATFRRWLVIVGSFALAIGGEVGTLAATIEIFRKRNKAEVWDWLAVARTSVSRAMDA